jgi:glycosyltransferase involved in cell wall biosynthesis
MKKVLMIAYEFPPIGGVGIIRTLKFSKYLSKFGWSPHVLTVKNRDRIDTSPGYDSIPENVQAYRSYNILNNLSLVEAGFRRLGIISKIVIPDAYIGWIPMAVQKGKKIIEKENIDVIYVTCSPFSSALIGAKLKALTGLPLVIDFRDSWTIDPHYPDYLFDFLEILDEKWEKYVFSSADFILTATEGIKDGYLEKYPFIESKIVCVTNGFDTTDIPAYVKPFDKFTVTYTGFFYGVQSPEYFFEALEIILKNNLIPEDEIQFLWAGRDAPFVQNLMKHYHIENICNYIGLVSKKEADELLYRSQMLLFVIGYSDKISLKSTLTGKIFPYLASGKPILTLVPDGPAKDMIYKYSDNSYIIHSENSTDYINQIIDAICNEFEIWKNKKNIINNSEKNTTFRSLYNYETLTKNVANIFNAISSKKDEKI